MATEAEIRKDERHRLAALLEGSGEYLVDFTGGSTMATVELIAYLLRLDHSEDDEPLTKTLTVCWAPEAIEAALQKFIEYRDGPVDAPRRGSQHVQVAVDCLRAALGGAPAVTEGDGG